MRQWVREGKTNAEIVRLLAEREGVSVSRQAISVWKRRAGVEMKDQPAKGMPWKVKEEHRQLEAARAIRNFNRVRRGDTLPEREQRRLDKAIESLAEIASEQGWKHGAVFHYEPDTDSGWFVVARRPGVDKGIVREPDPS